MLIRQTILLINVITQFREQKKGNLLTLHLILMLNTMKIQIKKYPKFKAGDHVRISKSKNIFAKGYTPNWPEEIFVVSKIKNAVPWTYVISGLNGEEIAGSFDEKESQKTNQEKFRIEKIIKTKGDKFYVKWKGYDNLFIVGLIKKTLY